MRDTELVETIVKTYIVEKNFKFKKDDIKNLIEESIDLKINKITEESFGDSKVLYIYFGVKRKKCLTFTILNETIRIDQII